MAEKEMIDVEDVAKYFIFRSNFDKYQYSTITPLKLQKLLYYAQAWHATRNNDEKIFEDVIEAWVHGPVVPKIYHKYKHYGYNNITEKVTDIPKSIQQNKDIKETLDVVWDLYNQFDAKTLEKMTHSEEPWQLARNGIPSYQASNATITLDSMTNYYRQYLE